MGLVEIFLLTLGVLALLPASVLLAQLLLALPAYRPRRIPATRRPSVTVLMPAHDEATTIGCSLKSIVPHLMPGDRLLVVADNCTDNTASVAYAAGAEVIERKDPARRGKGFALDFGIRHLERDASEVVVIVDADCEVQAGTLDRLALTCAKTGRPVQALYLMRAPERAPLKTQVAQFAWLVKNHMRPLGYHRLGLPCHLMGSGMAFPWRIIRDARLASGQIVEDLVLGIELARAGAPPQFCPEACVMSFFARSDEGARAQRTRWEHGHLAAIVQDAPRLLIGALRHGNRDLLALVVDLCVPPLALLAAVILALLGVSTAFFMATGRALPLGLAGASLVMFCLAVFAAWARHGRSVISLSSLVYAPVYAILKMPLYLRFVLKRQQEWVRSKRDGD